MNIIIVSIMIINWNNLMISFFIIISHPSYKDRKASTQKLRTPAKKQKIFNKVPYQGMNNIENNNHS